MPAHLLQLWIGLGPNFNDDHTMKMAIDLKRIRHFVAFLMGFGGKDHAPSFRQGAFRCFREPFHIGSRLGPDSDGRKRPTIQRPQKHKGPGDARDQVTDKGKPTLAIRFKCGGLSKFLPKTTARIGDEMFRGVGGPRVDFV